MYEANGRLWRESHGNDTLVYSYDKWGRLSYQNLMGTSANILTRTLVFDAGLDTEDGDKTTTTRIKQETLASSAGFSQTWGYTYDANGNIVGITRNGATYGTYAYDRWNQLTAATHNGVTYGYTYDVGGNIKSKTVNGVTTTYTYGDSLWKDLLTGYGSETFTYDTIGNPLTWRNGATMTWEGRRLTGYARQNSGLSMSFAYNADGIRTKKMVNGSVTEYTLDGSKIVRQKNGNQIVYFAYDAAGNLYSMTTGGTTYYYVRNMQGDILGLNDAGGNQVASYAYDPWGNITSVSGSNTTIANLNPFRYRGYYYDSETGLYYLQSRYYDPVVGRFISPDTVDILTASPTSMTDKNLFAYCDNNPIMREDDGGEFWNVVIGAAVGAVAGVVGQVISDVVTSVLNGEVTISNWQTYTGAAVGGAAGGVVLATTGNMNVANAVTGAITTGVGQSLEKLTISNYNKSWAEIGANTVVDGAVSYGLGKIPGIKGATAGRNSWSAVYKSGLTKLRNGTATRISAKVVAKGLGSSIVGGFALDGYYGVKQHAYDRVKNLLV